MDENIKKLLEKGILIGGVINRTKDNFITFERKSNIKDLEKAESEDSELAFATKTMGRAVFKINDDGKIENYKGVDSQLGENENALTKKTGTNVVKIDNPMYKGHHQIILKSSPGKGGKREYEVRFMGTSPLEDLEIEADINSKMSKFGIKVPEIQAVREFPKEIAETWGLPIHIKGNYEELKSKSEYAKEDKKRKENLKENKEIDYSDTLTVGSRPELLCEYFERCKLLSEQEFEEFLKNERAIVGNNNIQLQDFINHVDKQYSLGQRYGQTVRIVESPFRISDLEYYISEGDIEAIESIVKFSEGTITECINGTQPCMEEVFAKKMGKNLALLINNGWVIENMVHRQDYSLAGEMCDDSYFDLNAKWGNLGEVKNNGRLKLIKNQDEKSFLNQIHYISSNIKVLQDEMHLRGIDFKEISGILDAFVQQFINTIDIETLEKTTGRTKENLLNVFQSYFYTLDESYEYDIQNLPEDYRIDNKCARDYVLEMASKKRGNGLIYDDAILLASKGNQEFYRTVSEKMLQRLKAKYQLSEKTADMTNCVTDNISAILEKEYKDAEINESDLKNVLYNIISKPKEEQTQNETMPNAFESRE